MYYGGRVQNFSGLSKRPFHTKARGSRTCRKPVIKTGGGVTPLLVPVERPIPDGGVKKRMSYAAGCSAGAGAGAASYTSAM